jgi:hypothetical protein
MTDARFGGLVRETLDGSPKATLRVAGLAREALVSGKTNASFAGIVREILRTPEGITAPQRPWQRHEFVEEEPSELLWLRRHNCIGRPPAPPPTPQKPWQRHEFPEPEPDEGLALVRRHNTTGGVPPPPPSTRLRPYLLINV